MWKKLPLWAGVAALCACSSPPAIKYPSGSAARVPINAVTPFPMAPSTVTNGQARAVVAIAPPPEPVKPRLFLVNPDERSVMNVLRRWARAEKIDFTWESDIDYPLTDRIKAIDATNLEEAVAAMRRTLEGVKLPLQISLDSNGLAVRRAPMPLPVREPLLPPAPMSLGSALGAASQVAAKSTPPDAAAARRWEAKGDTLHAIVGRWAASANVRLDWNSGIDPPATSALRGGVYSGSLPQALRQLAERYGECRTPLSMKFLDNATVLRVYMPTRATGDAPDIVLGAACSPGGPATANPLVIGKEQAMADKASTPPVPAQGRMLSSLDWESDIVLNSRKSQALAWRLLAAAVVVIVLLAVAIALMLPLKQVVPSVVVVDKLTGEGAVVTTGQDFVTTSNLTDKHWVNSFVLSRERYVFRFIQYDYDTVRRLASDQVWANYRPLFDGDKALDKVYKDDIEVIPTVLSITLNGSGMATVRYELRTRDYRSTSPPVVTRRIATLRYSYEAKNLTLEKEAIANPLGFSVTAYQTDPELAAESAARVSP